MKTKNTTYENVIRGKGIYDGCKSIEEMINRLKNQIEEFEDYRANGVKLNSIVEDDYAVVFTDSVSVASRVGFNYNKK